MNTQIKRGLPHLFKFASSEGYMRAVGPDPEIHDQDLGATPMYRLGSTNFRQAVFTPSEYGPWQLWSQSSGASTAPATSHDFECVAAFDHEIALGVVNKHQELVPYYPPRIHRGDVLTHTVSATSAESLLTGKKLTIPYDGFVYGVRIYVGGDPSGFDSLRFFTGKWEDAAASINVRGISEDFSGTAPEEGSWPGSSEWRTIYFSKPVLGHAGDRFGLEIDNTSGGSNTVLRNSVLNTDSRTNGVQIRKTSALAALDTSNNFSATGTANVTLAIAPLMHPPAIAVAGHSFWAGSGANPTENMSGPYADSTAQYQSEYCIAQHLSKLLGVPCVNIAEGSTRLLSEGLVVDDDMAWVGSGGLCKQQLEASRPAVMLYDTTYSDTAYYADEDANNTAVIAGLDELLAQCDQLQVELVLMESPIPDEYDGNAKAAQMVTINRLIHKWADRNQVAYLPMHWRLSRDSGGSATATIRTQYRATANGIDEYGDADGVHIASEGRLAAAMALAQGFRGRRTVGTRFVDYGIGVTETQATIAAIESQKVS